jgi:hypothetical protein
MSLAFCDPDAFYPLRDLVKGPFRDLSQLQDVERMVRAVLLHDNLYMEPAPIVYDEEAEAEARREHIQTFTVRTKHPTHIPSSELRVTGIEIPPRHVILGLAPHTGDYLVFNNNIKIPGDALARLTLKKELIDHAAKHSNAGPGNIYYENHLNFLKQMMYVELSGGSAVVSSDFGVGGITIAQRFPAELFSTLNTEWQTYAKAINERGIGFLVPPFLGIVLKRCRNREEIPLRLKELRDEWAESRQKLWSIIKAYQNSKTSVEMAELERELTAATKYFAPSAEVDFNSRAIRIVWEILAGGIIGAATGTATGSTLVGAVSGMITADGKYISENLREVGNCLLGRGALDLANKVRLDVKEFDLQGLSRILSDSEKQNLGIA